MGVLFLTPSAAAAAATAADDGAIGHVNAYLVVVLPHSLMASS